MRLDYLPGDLNRLWQELASNPVQVSPEDLRREVRKLRSRVRLRNCFISGVCCLVIATYCVFFFYSTTALERIGSALSIVGTTFVAIQFLRRPGRRIPDSGAIECIRFYRSELERQRDLHRGKGVFSWLLPFLPGPILFNAAVALDSPMLAPLLWLQMAVFLLIAAIVVPLNIKLARKYEHRLNALDASQKQ
jgi:hypothetical protein